MHTAEQQRRFDEALAAPRPFPRLCELACGLRDEGMAQIELFLLFESQMEKNELDELRYDAIVDTLDEIYGGPWAKGGGFFSTKLSDEDIRRHKGLPPLEKIPYWNPSSSEPNDA